MLVAAGASVHDPGNCEMQPLHYAANEGVAEILLENGADVEGGSNRSAGRDTTSASRANSPLTEAAGDGRLDVVKLLVKHGAEIDSPQNGTTPLYWAAYYGRAGIVSFLISHGANVNGIDPYCLPGEAALKNRRTQTIRILLDADAALPKAGNSGWSVLHSAAFWQCNGEVIEMLVAAGAPVDATPMDKEQRFVDSFLFPDQPPRITGKRTLLHITAEVGNYSAAKALIANCANIHSVTSDGETPLSLTNRIEKFVYNPVVQGTQETVDSFNEHHRREIELAKSNRIKIAELIAKAREDERR